MSIMGPSEQFRGQTGYRGVDLASHQGPHFPFGRAWDDGYCFAFIKATGGHRYVNEYLGVQVLQARAAGFRVGFYHYFGEPSSGGGDIVRETANFIGAVRRAIAGQGAACGRGVGDTVADGGGAGREQGG